MEDYTILFVGVTFGVVGVSQTNLFFSAASIKRHFIQHMCGFPNITISFLVQRKISRVAILITISNVD